MKCVNCWLSRHTTYNDHINMIHRTNVGLMLDQRRRRWTNIKPTFGQCLVLAGDVMCNRPVFSTFNHQVLCGTQTRPTICTCLTLTRQDGILLLIRELKLSGVNLFICSLTDIDIHAVGKSFSCTPWAIIKVSVI